MTVENEETGIVVESLATTVTEATPEKRTVLDLVVLPGWKEMNRNLPRRPPVGLQLG